MEGTEAMEETTRDRKFQILAIIWAKSMLSISVVSCLHLDHRPFRIITLTLHLVHTYSLLPILRIFIINITG